MSRAYPILFWILLFWVLADFFTSHVPKTTHTEPYVPLEGTLFKGNIRAFSNSDTPITVHSELSNTTDLKNKQKTSQPPNVKTLLKSKHKSILAAQSETNKPRDRASLDLYAYFNNILAASSSAYQLSKRLTLGGVTIRLQALDQWKGEYLLKYSIKNKEDREFFNQSSIVLINEKEKTAQSYVPFSCRVGEEIYGILRFPLKDAQNKKIGLLIIESGGRKRRFKIEDIGYTS